MKHFAIGAVLALALAGAARAEPSDSELAAPIHAFIDAFNKGDAKAAAATHAPTDLAIIDEVPPYGWRGAGAFGAWAADLAANDAKAKITDQSVTIGEATRTEVDGGKAYVIVPAVYAYKQAGASMREPAQMTFALTQTASGWKIAGWTWTGPKPTAVAAKP